jgi:hypothetical protein
MHNSNPTPQGVKNRNILRLIWAQKGKFYIINENVM